MGGGAPNPQGSVEKINLDPRTEAQFRSTLNNVGGQTRAYQQQAGQTAGQIQTNFGQYAPNLQSNFLQYNPGLQTSFQAQGGLDQRSQAILSQARQQQQAQLGAQNAAIARQFQTQPGVANILQRQAQNRTALNSNPALFQVAEQQAARQQQEGLLANQARLQQSQQISALQQQGNQAQLQGTEANSGLAQAANAALAQRLGIQAQIPQASQNLLATQGTAGTLLGSRVAAPLSGFQGNYVANDILSDNYQNAPLTRAPRK